MMLAVSQEEEKKSSQMGECLEYLLTERIPFTLIGHAKSNNPKGLLELILRFMVSLFTTVNH